MVYLNNDTNQQEVWIPRNDGLGATHKSSYDQGFEDGYASGETHQKNLLTTTAFTENGEYSRENGWSAVTVSVPGSTARLEAKNVTITADTTNILPSSGYDGMSAVTVDASEYGQSNYDSGFDDGFEDGYSSGSTEQKELLTTTAFTENGSYTRENGWSGVSVNVDTASTYSSGYTDGQDSIISTFSSMTATTNGQYGSSAHPYTAVTVNVPQTGTSATLEEKDVVVTGVSMTVNPSQGFDGMSKVNLDALGLTGQYWQSGHTQGIEDQKMLLSSAEFSANGVYNRANGWDRVTVNVPQTGSTAVLGTGSFSANGSYSASTDNLDGYSAVTVSIDTASTWNSGYTSGHTDGVNEEKAKMSAVTFTANTAVTLADGSYSAVTVNVPQTGSSAVLGTKSITGNGTYNASDYNFDGFSAVTVGVYGETKMITKVASIHTLDIGRYFLDTGIIPTTATTFRVKGVGIDNSLTMVYADINSQYNTYSLYQTDDIVSGGTLYWSVNSRTRSDEDWGTMYSGRIVDLTCSDYSLVDNVTSSAITASTASFTATGNVMVNIGQWWLKSIQIWEGNELVFDGEAAVDNDGHIGLYDSVSDTLVYDPDYTMVYENPVLGNVTLTANGIYNASNFGTEGFSAVTVNVTENYGELIGLYCTNNCQFVLGHGHYLEDTSISFGIRTGNVSINVGSDATAPSVNRIEVDSNGNVTGNSYSYNINTGSYSTGSGQTSVVLNAFPTKNYMRIETGVKNTTKVNGSSASTCMFYQNTPANGLLLSIDDGYFYGEYINNPGSDLQSCIYPHVDNDGNACILGSSRLFYPISGECYPIYKNGNNYYVLMKTQPWNQQ